MKNALQLSLAATAVLLFISSNSVKAQTDSSHVARTQSFSGTVTYDGSGAGTGGTEGTYVGYNAGAVTSGTKNSFFGANSGSANTTGNYNSYFGASSGSSNTTGLSNNYFGYFAGYSGTTASGNSFFGTSSGYSNTTGEKNTFFGNVSGYKNTTGGDNTFMGSYTGYANTTGLRNTYIGGTTGTVNTTGNYNTMVGNRAGFTNITGTGNVFLGYYAGGQELGSNKLYISNSNTTTPLLYGDFTDTKLVVNGKLGVSTSTFPSTVGTADVSAYKLFVQGGILTDELRIRTGWADYVFEKNYKLQSLSEVEHFIKKNGHLPNVPSAKSVESDGLSVGEIARIQQEKLEELTLHLIEQSKEINNLRKEINELKAATQKRTDR